MDQQNVQTLEHIRYILKKKSFVPPSGRLIFRVYRNISQEEVKVIVRYFTVIFIIK